MITNGPNIKLSSNPGFDLKTYLDGILLCLLIETDLSIPMAIKFSSHTPYCSMNGFPVFRMEAKIRRKLKRILIKYKPSDML